MRQHFETAINNLVAASGGRVWIRDSDRDTETQRILWVNKLAEYGLPPDIDPDDPRAADARKVVAPPGYSNHERGIAADLGGDLDYAAELAPQFGLWFPMDWEPWHIEIVGSRDEGSPDAYTTPPVGYTPPQDKNKSLEQMLLGLFGVAKPVMATMDPIASKYRTSISRMALSPERAKAPVFTTSVGGPTGIDAFMNALRDVESSGNYKAVGVETLWGRASGAYQFLDGTWNGYEGYSRAADAPPDVQDRKARELMQSYYNQFGDWDSVAAAWYSGPGGNFQSAEVQEYVGKVKSRL